MQETKNAVIIVSEMKQRRAGDQNWKTASAHTTKQMRNSRLLKNVSIFTAAALFSGIFGFLILHHPESAQMAMSHLRADFEYDEMLGRLQFVKHLLPESIVFSPEKNDNAALMSVVPLNAQTLHAWSQNEPWLEYSCVGEINACQNGQIATIVKNRNNEYTVRIAHQNGYESLYSGLKDVQVNEYDAVFQGQQIGTAAGYAAFEWRKDGLSILPAQFSSESVANEI